MRCQQQAERIHRLDFAAQAVQLRLRIRAAAWDAMPGQPTYTAAKAGMVGFSRALALAVVGDSVTVNVVAPEYISTDSQLPFEAAAAAGPVGRSGTPAVDAGPRPHPDRAVVEHEVPNSLS